MPFIRIDGARLHFEVTGDTRPALVLVLGYTGSAGDWRAQLPLSRARQVVAADHWGHGRSEPPLGRSGYDIERVAQNVIALATHLHLDAFHLVGHSLGGAVAQELALCEPARVRSLILADTTDWFGDHEQGAGPRRRRTLTDAERARLERLPTAVLPATWEALLRWRGTRDRAARIAAPTLIVHGEDDAPKIVEGSRRLALAIPDAEVVTIAGAGHDPHIEQPLQFNALVERFLTSI